MKIKLLRELKNAFLLFWWLLLVQVTSSLLTVIIAVVLELIAYGGIRLLGRTLLWEWIVIGVLIGLFWLVMGRAASHVVQPEPAGAAVVLIVWAVLTALMSNVIYLLLMAQAAFGGMLEQILRSLGYGVWSDERVTLAAYLLLPAAFGVGLLRGRRRPSVPEP